MNTTVHSRLPSRRPVRWRACTVALTLTLHLVEEEYLSFIIVVVISNNKAIIAIHAQTGNIGGASEA